MCGDGKEKLFEVEVAYGVAAREAARGATGEVSEVRRVSRSQLAPSWLARSVGLSVCADDSELNRVKCADVVRLRRSGMPMDGDATDKSAPSLVQSSETNQTRHAPLVPPHIHLAANFNKLADDPYPDDKAYSCTYEILLNVSIGMLLTSSILMDLTVPTERDYSALLSTSMMESGLAWIRGQRSHFTEPISTVIRKNLSFL